MFELHYTLNGRTECVAGPFETSQDAQDCLDECPTCTQESEKENYSRINMELVGRNLALESSLKIAKKEIFELNKKIEELRGHKI